MSDEDVKATQGKGFECEKMDPSFMTFEDESFDFPFVRHCLEHLFHSHLVNSRVLKTGGKAYIEMS